MARQEVEFSEEIAPLYQATKGNGLLLTSSAEDGRPNVMTVGWGLYGWFYHDHPVAVVAIRPACYTSGFLEEVGEFVLAVPADDLAEAVRFCGTESGRDYDKFAETGLTKVASLRVRPVSIAQCPINVECRIYRKECPPHHILTPEHREKPVSEQHAIYFAEVLGTYAWT